MYISHLYVLFCIILLIFSLHMYGAEECLLFPQSQSTSPVFRGLICVSLHFPFLWTVRRDLGMEKWLSVGSLQVPRECCEGGFQGLSSCEWSGKKQGCEEEKAIWWCWPNRTLTALLTDLSPGPEHLHLTQLLPPDIAKKNTRCPIKSELQINMNSIYEY